jgi:DNA-binding beta-propeller fold protein YncE
VPFPSKRSFLTLAFSGAVAIATPVAVRAAACPYTETATKTVSVPGRPFGIKATADGCWLFVSLIGNPPAGGAIAVLRNEHGDFRLDHVVKVPGQPGGMSLADSGRVLAAAAQDRILLLDVAKLERGGQQPVTSDIFDQANAGAVYAQFALRDRVVFVSEEQKSRIAVIDVERAEQGDTAHSIVNRVITDIDPVGLALSPDGLRLFATSEITPPSAALPSLCAPAQPGDRASPEGRLLAIDVQAAATGPSKSVLAGWAAGCSPVRVALSADGSKVWVTARGDGELLEFSTRELSRGVSSTTAIRHKVGSSPVGLAVRPDGGQVWVANSDRFSTSASGTLTCISLTDTSERSVASGRFPRELTFLPDGKTLVVTVFGSSELQFVPTAEAGRAAGACGPAQTN